MTGGIASGKSTVSRYLKESGFPVIDADVIAREVMEPGEPAYLKVIECFGREILNKDRSIDRKTLGDIVFNDSEKLKQLNALVQKEIFAEIMKKKSELSADEHKLIVLDIPLLYEAGYDQAVDEVMVVYVDYSTQLSRLKKRDQLTESAAVKRIEAQEPLKSKKDKADVVIDNSGTREQTKQQIDDWLTKNDYSSPL
ncbi:dephospho-CoA kinase [Alkalibacterium putridalgicola]|uniref:Dephospho-CoA kinase n=1 Tax=Alkalibacterium putridalgicola TaxID=426703 RepID=A0A1H7SYB6_9LACT|nr:dephospho-CoA kinase [Alkalibacterium putridalgicola]GEK89237.1 dephospho-CoA kinase [Alkalibacterium putridalgicola]SEL77315.1 dephospho-CoA kinase [Alkalibacterium putridalgicola]